MSAPVCHVSPATQISQPPQVQLPSIPQASANNMNSIINAINAITQAIQMLAGQIRPSGMAVNGQLLSQGASGGFSVKGGSSPPPSKQAPTGSWTQIGENTTITRVVNPSDDTQFVDVKRVNSVTLQNSATGQIITIKT